LRFNYPRAKHKKGEMQTSCPNDAYPSDASQFERVFSSSDGKLVRIIRAEAHADTIPPSAKHDTASMMITSFGPEGQQRVRVSPNAVVWPDVYPAFTAVESDAEGNLWARPYPREVQTGLQAWLVFDSTGALRGKAQVPLLSNIVEIGGNHLIGRILDSLGVETVRVYRIRKGGV
jgi:hypothetical protein